MRENVVIQTVHVQSEACLGYMCLLQVSYNPLPWNATQWSGNHSLTSADPPGYLLAPSTTRVGILLRHDMNDSLLLARSTWCQLLPVLLPCCEVMIF